MKRVFCLLTFALFGSALLETLRVASPWNGVTLALGEPVASAQTTFRARIKAVLCPEYPFGGVSVRFHYQAGGRMALAVVASETIDAAKNTGTFEIELPTQFASSPLRVQASCVSSFGTSKASNALRVSYCDALQLKDSDGDGLFDREEDQNCNGLFDPLDLSHFLIADTDGDGDSDQREVAENTNPLSPTSSSRPKIIGGAPFDPDGDGETNPVVFRPSEAAWYVRDFQSAGNQLRFQFGLSSDLPFVYRPRNGTSNVGVIRRTGSTYTWIFRGDGFELSSGLRQDSIQFGAPGDTLLPGSWESSSFTSPAVAKLVGQSLVFEVYLRDGSVQSRPWGVLGDTPVPGDYDGDGVLDLAVYRPSEGNTYIVYSSDGTTHTLYFPAPAGELPFAGDVTGDARADLTFWEPTARLFKTLKSDNGFDVALAAAKHPAHYQEVAFSLTPLASAEQERPLTGTVHSGVEVYSLIDHQTGVRRFRIGNDPTTPPTSIQWGFPGDCQG